VAIESGHYDDAHYWRYRLRLVALLGLAQLETGAAREELFELHERGSETERMDVLLCCQELGAVPQFAFDDLKSAEPKLVATAVELIRTHGNPPQRAWLIEHFRARPLWQQFRDSGLDDHGILRRLDAMTKEPTR